MKLKYLFGGVLLLIFLIVAGWWVEKELRIDSCLDLGGRWDYEAEKCQTVAET